MDPEKETADDNCHKMVTWDTGVDIDINSIQSAMNNHVILKHIFGYLTLTEVKKVRTICKLWNNVGTPVLIKRTSTLLSLNKVCLGLSNQEILEASSHIRDQFVRNIKISYDPSTFPSTLPPRFLVIYPCFTSQFRNVIETIEFHGNCLFSPLLAYILRQTFPVLRKICIRELFDWSVNQGSNDGIHRDNRPRTCITGFPAIQTLEFSAGYSEEGQQGRSLYDCTYQTLIQELIYKSPNLQVLKIVDNFYPDLSTCSKLKSLEWTGNPNMPQGFKTSRAVQLMEQVKGVLETVVLDTSFKVRGGFRRHVPPVMEKRSLPKLPKLVSLTIVEDEVYLGLYSTLAGHMCPALKTLSIDINASKLCMEKSSVCFKNLETLCLYSFNGLKVNLYYRIAKLFPNVKKLTIGISPITVNDENLKNIALSLDKMGLTLLNDLTINIELKCTLSTLMESLCVIALKGLKTLSIVVNGPSVVVDDGCNNFYSTFLAYPKMIFDGFLLKGNTSFKMHNFIGNHHLNVYFYN